jgi:membrane-bound metal-dependent hydrolase YbcI (DUF457 family)
MNGTAHQATTAGAALAACAATGVTGNQAIAFLATAVVCSGGPLSPDVDMRLPFVSHRGPTHYLPFVVVLAYVLHEILATQAPVYATAIAAGFLFGWTLHILEDGLTPEGIPVWPFGSRVGDRNHIGHVLPDVGPLRVRIVAGPPKDGHTYLAVNQWFVAAPALSAGLLLLPGVLT